MPRMDGGEATRGVEDDHDGVVAVVLGTRDGVVEVLLGDRVDVVVECRRKHAWPRLFPRPVTRLGDRNCRNREGSHAEREQQSPKWATVHAVRIASTQGSAACARTVCEQLCPQMRRLLVLFLMLTAGAVLPATSVAGVASVTTVDLTSASDRSPSSLAHAHRFTLVGLHWRGTGTVVFRTRSLAGRWTTWRPAAPEDEDGPDLGSRESRAAGWHVGSPWWVGPSNRLEIRTSGQVARVRARLVWSPASSSSYRAPATAAASAGTVMPAIVSRAAWGANESIRRAPPSYAPSVRFAIVHHTAGTNTYSRDEAAAIVRGIQLYHVRGNGWNDIGYNFLVDRFGTIYEGRYGGVDRNVVGAHALGFNTGSTGIALLGTYGDAKPTRAALDSLTKLLAWRLDLAHVDPLSVVTVLSGGSERFRPNVPVSLRAISGHRDTGLTECPGIVSTAS